MTVAGFCFAFSVANRSRPPILGIRTSVKMTSGPKLSTSKRALSPLSATSTS